MANGRYRYLVSEPAGCDLVDSKEASARCRLYPIRIVGAIAAQAVLGSGDMYVDGAVLILSRAYANVLIRFPFKKHRLLLTRCNPLFTDRIYQRFDEPVETEIERIDRAPPVPEAPSYSLWSVRLVMATDKVSDPRILTFDFGEAWFSKTETREFLVTSYLFDCQR